MKGIVDVALPEADLDDGSPGAWADRALREAIGCLGGLLEGGIVLLEPDERAVLRWARVTLVDVGNRLRVKYRQERLTTTWYAAERRALKGGRGEAG